MQDPDLCNADWHNEKGLSRQIVQCSKLNVEYKGR